MRHPFLGWSLTVAALALGCYNALVLLYIWLAANPAGRFTLLLNTHGERLVETGFIAGEVVLSALVLGLVAGSLPREAWDERA